jgi:hypothetical protein
MHPSITTAALPGVDLTHYIRSGGYFLPKGGYLPGWSDPKSIITTTRSRDWALRYIPLARRVYKFFLFKEVSRI